jgi:polysaccharide deacetylase family protein (PEP-CTERM system associated)
MRADMTQVENIMSVDVEDYFQVSAFERVVARKDWDTYECRVERNIHKLLELFDRYNVKITFFVLGWIAERYPDMIVELANRGHEVACHGYSHRLVYNQTPEEFREETIRSKSILEDIVQQPVFGYRAASYSITQNSMWALDILAESGFLYDSSIFPIRHDRYGVPDAERRPHRLRTPKGHSIVEFPLSTVKILNYRLPISGGGYFRLYPYFVTKMGLKLVNRDQPFMFYLHPWEVDPGQPRINNASFKSRFRHYNNLDKCEMRLEQLLKDFEFSTTRNVLKKLGLLNLDEISHKQSAHAAV